MPGSHHDAGRKNFSKSGSLACAAPAAFRFSATFLPSFLRILPRTSSRLAPMPVLRAWAEEEDWASTTGTTGTFRSASGDASPAESPAEITARVYSLGSWQGLAGGGGGGGGGEGSGLSEWERNEPGESVRCESDRCHSACLFNWYRTWIV